jgi:3',5'-cyclic AMP phosphodiesterase CpdA
MRLLPALLFALATLPALAGEQIVYAVGDIAECNGPPSEAAAARTARLVPDGATVLMLGDAVYPRGEARYFESCYAPTWGRHRAATLAVPGNHEYYAANGAGFFAYFGDRAGDNGHFATRLGRWRIIGLNSNLDGAAMELQYRWLAATLAAPAGDAGCLLAFWHHPLFSSGRRGQGAEAMQRFWELLEAHRADLVLNGHEHYYEAFAPQLADGSAAAAGIREFVVGTGGAHLYEVAAVAANRSAHLRAYGVLRLGLGDDGYRRDFLDEGGRVLDHGEATCHR